MNSQNDTKSRTRDRQNEYRRKSRHLEKEAMDLRGRVNLLESECAFEKSLNSEIQKKYNEVSSKLSKLEKNNGNIFWHIERLFFIDLFSKSSWF